jgi:hypothetical protein
MICASLPSPYFAPIKTFSASYAFLPLFSMRTGRDHDLTVSCLRPAICLGRSLRGPCGDVDHQAVVELSHVVERELLSLGATPGVAAVALALRVRARNRLAQVEGWAPPAVTLGCGLGGRLNAASSKSAARRKSKDHPDERPRESPHRPTPYRLVHLPSCAKAAAKVTREMEGGARPPGAHRRRRVLVRTP